MLSRLIVAIATITRLMAADFDWKLPQGFPRPAVPASNPMSAAKVELGRYLFYDKRMSVNGRQSCGTCHRQEIAFTDGRARAEGTTGQRHPRSSMSLVNVAYTQFLTWADPVLDSLEQQALVPMLGEMPVELGLKGHQQEFLAAVRSDPVYQARFPRVFADERDPFTLANVTKAIAAFERSIVSMRSPYDRYRWSGDLSAISDAAKRGELVFFSSERGGCFRCHGGWNFAGAVRFEGAEPDPDATRNVFFNTGVSSYEAPNRGTYEHTGKQEDIGKFRAPSLRNIAITAPYMHDGSLATLDDVLDHYIAGGRAQHPNKSHILRRLNLSADDRRDLVEFLKSLTDRELLRDPRWSDPWPEPQ